MKVVLLLASLASLLVLTTAAYRENFQGRWREAQAAYRQKLMETADSEAARHAAEAFSIEHKQLYLPKLHTIDRCTTCHLGVENPAMADAEQPLRRHSGDTLAQHPPDKFGCTICHQGGGRATTKEAAHGWHDDGSPVKHMDAPMLRGEAVYTSCGRCHYELDLYGGERDVFAGSGQPGTSEKTVPPIHEATLRRSLPGAETLALGKELVVDSGCLGCHKYRGRGGVLGPDLTYVGDKTKHDFDFSHVNGEHTVEQWLYEHFMVPGEVSPGTLMPEMGLTQREGRALALYMMGLHRKTAPASHLPIPKTIDPTSAPRETVTTVRGTTLYRMYCSACHGPDGFGTTMRAGLWPSDADPWGRQWDAQDVVVERRGDLDVMVPSLNHEDTLATVSDDYLRHIIAHGRPGTKMLAWSDEGALTDDEITLLVEFIRRWNPPVPDREAVATARGDARVGGALYRANCAACHGTNGEGGIGNSLNSPTFLAVASDAFLRDTIIYGRPNTAMPAWREFTSQEISDLMAFIRGWQPRQSDEQTVAALCEDTAAEGVSASIGHTLYKANCVMCHGRDGSGDLGPSLNTQAFLTVVGNDYLARTMIEGRPGTGMPSWRHLSNDDVASLIRFLRTWQTQPSKPPNWHAQRVPHGDWDAGRQLFRGSCAGCHGVDGEGATGPQLNNPIFLSSASDVMLREWIRNGKPGTEMLGFRKGGQGVTELTERQIEDIIAYLRLLERGGDGDVTRVAKSPYGRPGKGAAVYARSCVGCHGDRGEGASGPALSNPEFLKRASDGFLMATMALGRDGTEMRPVKRGPQSILGLSSDEVNDLVAFLRSWEHAPPFDPADVYDLPHRFVVPWDLANGRALFASHCAGCHGEEGKGLWAPELNNEGFLAAATDGFLQATIVRGRKGTAMRPFGTGGQGLVDLPSDDIDDIVAYIRRWSKSTPSPMTIPAQRSLEYEAPPSDSITRRSPRAGPDETASRRRTSAQQPVSDSKTDHRQPVAAAVVPVQGD